MDEVLVTVRKRMDRLLDKNSVKVRRSDSRGAAQVVDTDGFGSKLSVPPFQFMSNATWAVASVITQSHSRKVKALPQNAEKHLKYLSLSCSLFRRHDSPSTFTQTCNACLNQSKPMTMQVYKSG